MSRILKQVLIVFCIAFFPNITMSDELLKNPRLDCGVAFAKGEFFGYLPPKLGDRLQLDLNELPHYSNQLRFSSGAYIPLNGPLETVRSKDASEQKLTIDLEIYSEANQRKGKLWILHEEPLMESISILDCEIKR